MRVTLKRGAWVDPAEMMKAIYDSGFTPMPEEVTLTVTGTLEMRDGSIVVTLDRMAIPKSVTCFTLRPGDAVQEELERNAGRAVEIRGLWEPEGKGRLQVVKIEVIPPRE